jgi:flagellar motor switch protein FliG
MGKTSPEHIREIEKIMERKLTSLGYTDFTRVGGIETTVSILNSIDRSTEKFILEIWNLSMPDWSKRSRARCFCLKTLSSWIASRCSVFSRISAMTIWFWR